MSKKSKSEKMFEAFCSLNQISFEKIETSTQQRPDYRIFLSGNEVIVEVKQFEPNEEEEEIIRRKAAGENIPFGVIPGKRIRGEIRSANRQLKTVTQEDKPTLLVVFDNVTPLCLHTNEYSVMTAMKGLDTILVYVPKKLQDPPVFGETISGKEKAMRSDANTTISAVAVLHPYDDDNIGLSIYHNCFARAPIDPALLRVSNVQQFCLPKESHNSLDCWEHL